MRPILLLLIPSIASAANVRQDRPRILIGNAGTTLAVFQQRCNSNPDYMQRCQSALANGSGPENRAAAYLISGNNAVCSDAFTQLQMVASDVPGKPDQHSFISNNGRTMLQMAIVYDWCNPALSDPQKQWIENQMTAFGDWYVSSSAALDVYHDDMNNVWSAVALAGLTLKYTSKDSQATTYLTKADQQWKQVILPALAYEADWWHEGFTYVQPSVGSAAIYATAWTIATDEDLYAWARANANDVFEKYLLFHAYSIRPDYHYVYFGDSSDNKQFIELFSRGLIDTLTVTSHSPLGQALSVEIRDHSRPYYDY